MIGTKLAHYEITSHLGSGGMGDVYQATDSKLGRSVAIKLLPAAFTHDGDRAARFEREARVLASLSHPNIAVIHGIEESGGRKFLVMELVGGETLAAKVKRGAIPLEEALGIAMQITEALEAAHEKGVVHRDLKPGNVMMTSEGKVKVLDFGLAKARETNPSNPIMSNSPTMQTMASMAATNAGVILGTAAHMSPEQASGKPVDKRADIWSFGVVLWEMLTGHSLFGGETVSHTLADVLRGPIDCGKLRAPKPIQDLLRRCLDRDVKTRLRDIGEARVAIVRFVANPSGGADSPAQAAGLPLRTSKLPWVAAAALGLIAAAAGLGWWGATRPVDHPLVRISADLGPDALTSANITVPISPDGRRIVFHVRGPGGKPQLATRLLDQPTPTLLSGTDNAGNPFFSPDGQWIGFNADGKLKKISVLGGAALGLCDMLGMPGASWGEDGNIIVTLYNGAGAGVSTPCRS